MGDPNAAPDNQGNADAGKSGQKEKWEELGFESEEAFIGAAREAAELRVKISEAEEALEKEKTSRQKTDSAFMRQSNELGELRKQLKELEAGRAPAAESKDDDELLGSLSEDDVKRFDELLDKPENIELKKAVQKGGTKAMAEFVRSVQKHAPADLKAPIFAALKTKKSDVISKASIAGMVRELFEKKEETERNKLPVTTKSGSPGEIGNPAKKPSVIGTVTADYFRKDK